MPLFLIALVVSNAFLPAEWLSAACGVYILSVVALAGSVPKGLLHFGALPAVLIAVGMPGLVVNDPYEAARDTWYFLNPLLVLSTGYLIAYRNNVRVQFGAAFIVAGTLVAVYHIGTVLLNLDALAISQEHLRNAVGGGYFAPVVNVLFVVYARGNQELLGSMARRDWLLNIALVLAVVSVGLSFSRTLYLSTLLCFAANLRFKSPRGRYVSMIPLALLGAVILASQLGPLASSSRSLLSSFDETNWWAERTQKYEGWRGTEAKQALMTYLDGNLLQNIFGLGFGRRIELGSQVSINGTMYNDVPIIHNGFFYLLVKTGLVGLAGFLLFLLTMYRAASGMASSKTPSGPALSALLKSVGVILTFSMFVVMGMYNKSILMPVLLLLGCLGSRYRPAGIHRWCAVRSPATAFFAVSPALTAGPIPAIGSPAVRLAPLSQIEKPELT